MISMYWSEFGILFVSALLGSLAVLPYSLKIFNKPGQNKPVKMSISKLLFLSFLQTAVISAVTIGVGLLASHAIGLGAPYIEGALKGNGVPGIAIMLRSAIVLGVLAGALLLFADILFLPYLPQSLLDATRRTSIPDNFLASFYGGLNEEFLMRLFGLSVLLWLLSRLWHTSSGLPTDAAFWSVNIVMAIIFGLGHLPATKNILGSISPLILIRTLLLNAPIGLVCGWLFWRYGIEAAVVAHFSADIIYHIGGTIALRLNDRHHFVPYS